MDNNKVNARVLGFVIGIIVFIIGLSTGSGALLVGLIIMILSLSQKKNKEKSSDDIVSGVNKSMPGKTSYIRSAENNNSVQERKKYGDGSEDTNKCPICKKISYNGYCSNCGFRFK